MAPGRAESDPNSKLHTPQTSSLPTKVPGASLAPSQANHARIRPLQFTPLEERQHVIQAISYSLRSITSITLDRTQDEVCQTTEP